MLLLAIVPQRMLCRNTTVKVASNNINSTPNPHTLEVCEMKRTVKAFIALLVVAIGLSSCSIITPVCATSNPVGSKRGEATGTGFLNVLMFGIDASVYTAAKNGGITKISTVDFKRTDILGIIQTYTCIVY